MPYWELDDTRYFYYSFSPPQGGGNPIVFIHGAGGNGAHWLKQLIYLKERFQVFAPDLPGHGRSGGAACDQIKQYSDFIHRFATKISGAPFCLVGHSMGGAIALDFSLNHPEMLAGMVLIATGARFSAVNTILEMLKNGRHNTELVKLVYSENALPQFEELAQKEIRAIKSIVWIKDFSACKHFNVVSRLAEIRLPAYIATGSADLLTPLSYGRLLEHNLPQAKFVAVAGAGHMLMLEKPDCINKLIVDFVSSK